MQAFGREKSIIKERILRYLDFKGISKYDCYNKTGISRSVLSQSNGMTEDNILKFLAYYNDMNTEWLLTGKGEMLKIDNPQDMTEQVASNIVYANDDESLNIKFYTSSFKQKGYSPYYGELPVSAGQHDLATISQHVEPESWIKIPNITADAWFPVIGCSMEPKIHAGDIIGISNMDSWERLDPDKIYLVITHDDRMIKHLEMDSEDDEIIWAISDNYRKIRLYRNEIICVYHVVFAGRAL